MLQSENSFVKIYKAEIILLLVTISWGLSFPLIKIALQFVSPLLFNFIRFAITFLIFIFFAKGKMNFLNYNEWKFGVFLGIFLFSALAFQTIGLEYTTASKSAFITGTNLIFVPFVQYMILKTKPKPENIFGAIIVLIGLYILSEAYFTKPNKGDILTFICAVSYSFHIILVDKFSRKINFYYLVFGQFLVMTILSFLFMLLFEKIIYDGMFLKLNMTFALLLVYTSVFSILLSIFFVTKYQHETTPLRAGIIYNMESLFTVLFSYILLNEILNLNQIVGAILMFLGLMISEFYGLIKNKFTKKKKFES